MDYSQILRDNLRDLIKQKGITQAWLADKTKTTEATISRYLSGVHNPKIDLVAKMAEAMGVSVDYLLGLSSSTIPNEPPSLEVRTLLAAYHRADAHTKKMVWMQLDLFLTDDEKTLAPQQSSKQKVETA